MTLHEDKNRTQQGLWFSFEHENDEFIAFISSEALTLYFNASEKKSSQLCAYQKNKERIELVARQKFLNGAPRPVKLGSGDFR